MTNKTTVTEYQESTGTLFSMTQRRLKDIDTGEAILIDEIRKLSYGAKQFWKCYLMDFLTVLGIIDSKQLDVFVFIAENTNPNTNLFIGTYKKICKDVGVSEGTVATIMKKLQDNGFIKMVQRGLWLVNPNILMKGSDKKRQILLTYYQSDSPVDAITFRRTRKKAYEENPDQMTIEGIITK